MGITSYFKYIRRLFEPRPAEPKRSIQWRPHGNPLFRTPPPPPPDVDLLGNPTTPDGWHALPPPGAYQRYMEQRERDGY